MKNVYYKAARKVDDGYDKDEHEFACICISRVVKYKPTLGHYRDDYQDVFAPTPGLFGGVFFGDIRGNVHQLQRELSLLFMHEMTKGE